MDMRRAYIGQLSDQGGQLNKARSKYSVAGKGLENEGVAKQGDSGSGTSLKNPAPDVDTVDTLSLARIRRLKHALT